MPEHFVDVIGLEIGEARRRLEAAGVAIASISETRPPIPHVEVSGPLRVIRQRATPAGGVELVVTPERYDPESLRPKPRDR